MREKIAETTCSICKFKSWCEFDARERNAGAEVDAIADCPHITAIEALFTAETAAMREALTFCKEAILTTYTLYMPVDVAVRMLDQLIADTALKGGK